MLVGPNEIDHQSVISIEVVVDQIQLQQRGELRRPNFYAIEPILATLLLDIAVIPKMEIKYVPAVADYESFAAHRI